MDKQAFLVEYNISEEDLTAADISWEELVLIEQEYRKLEKTMRELGKSLIDEYLYDIEKAGIHSYRYRTKDAWHLLEKVIRKKKRKPPEVCDRPDRHPRFLPVPGGLDPFSPVHHQPV